MAVQACSIFYNVSLFKHQPLEYLDDVFQQQQVPDNVESSLHVMRQYMPTNTPVPEYRAATLEQETQKKTCCAANNTPHFISSEEVSISQNSYSEFRFS